MGAIYSIRDVGRFTLFSTVVLQPEWLGRPDPNVAARPGYLDDRTVLAFGYCVGQALPGTRRAATRHETNMNVAAQCVDESFAADGLIWRIPALTPAEFRIDGVERPYEVTSQDVREFVGAARMGFYCGGEKPFYEVPLAARPVIHDADDSAQPEDGDEIHQDAVGSWGQRLTVISPSFQLQRLEKFWWQIDFTARLPELGGPVTVICAIENARTRAVA